MSSLHLQYYGLKCLSIIGLLLVTFALPHVVPGPPLRLYESRFDGADQRERLTVFYGFDRPLAVQYSIWMQRVATGQWGLSRHYHRPVFNDILRATGLTLLHLLWTVASFGIWTVVLNVFYRVWKPRQRPAPWQHNLRWLEVMPNFLIALVLYDVAVWELGWGDLVNVSLFDPDYYRKPVLMLSLTSVLALTPLVVWHTRVQNMQPCEPGSIWGRYRGQGRRFCRHFRPLLGVFLMELLLTEYVFTLPGLGSVGIHAVRRRDFPLLQGFLLGTGGLYLVMGMLLDRYHSAGQAKAQALETPSTPTGLRHLMRPMLGLIVLFALASWAPHLAPHDPTEIHADDRLRLPSARYPLGTDFLGRDVLSRTLHGFRMALPRVLLVSAGIAALSGLLAAFTRRLPSGWQLGCRAIPLLFEAFPPFLLVLMVVLVVERQFKPWSCEVTLFLAGIPVGLALFRDRVSVLRFIINLATIGQLILILDVVFFYLRLSPEPITPTWGGDIRLGAQYSHVNIWSLLSPIIAVVGSRAILHQFSIYGCSPTAPPPSLAITASRTEADADTTATGR